MIFENYRELGDHLISQTVNKLPHRDDIEYDLGYSNVSASVYLEVTLWELDEDGDPWEAIGGCNVRFSDHADRYGSDKSIRYDNQLTNDEYGHVEIPDYKIDQLVDDAVEFIKSELTLQYNDWVKDQ